MPKRKKRGSTPDIMKIIRDRGLGAPIAAACGIKRQAVPQWKKVPSEYVVTVEQFTGISRHDIRPDLSSIFHSRG